MSSCNALHISTTGQRCGACLSAAHDAPLVLNHDEGLFAFYETPSWKVQKRHVPQQILFGTLFNNLSLTGIDAGSSMGIEDG